MYGFLKDKTIDKEAQDILNACITEEQADNLIYKL